MCPSGGYTLARLDLLCSRRDTAKSCPQCLGYEGYRYVRSTCRLFHYVTSWAVVLAGGDGGGLKPYLKSSLCPHRVRGHGDHPSLPCISFFLFSSASSKIASVACVNPSLGNQQTAKAHVGRVLCFQKRVPLFSRIYSHDAVLHGGFSDERESPSDELLSSTSSTSQHHQPPRPTYPPTLPPTCQGPSPVPGPKLTPPSTPYFSRHEFFT